MHLAARTRLDIPIVCFRNEGNARNPPAVPVPEAHKLPSDLGKSTEMFEEERDK